MKYELTSNTIVYKGRILYQIKAATFNGAIKPGRLGGYISDKSCLSQEGKCWLEDGVKVIDSRIEGNIKVAAGTTIINSCLKGTMFIDKDCYIDNCNLSSWDYTGQIFSGTIIENKEFQFRCKLDNRITNSGYFRVINRGDAHVLCGNEYVKAGCITLTYLQAYQALTGENNILKENLIKHYSTSQQWVTHKDFLIQECKKELQRLGIKKEEGA